MISLREITEKPKKESEKHMGNNLGKSHEKVEKNKFFGETSRKQAEKYLIIRETSRETRRNQRKPAEKTEKVSENHTETVR